MAGDVADPHSVVIPAVSVPSTIACLRSLGAEGVHTIVVSEDESTPAFSSTYCDEAVSVPDPETDLDGYATALLALASRDDVRTIVPVREEDAFVLSKYRGAFADHVATPWPTFDQLRDVHDRVRLATGAASAGVPCPRTRPLREVTAWDEPRVIKSRYNLLVSEYASATHPGRATQQKAIRYLEPGVEPDVDAVCEAFHHEPIVQSFVPGGDEYMVGALCENGTVVTAIQHRQVRGTSYANGGGVYRRCVHHPELDAVARAVLEELEWHGLACIEYVYHPTTDEFVLVEINPRMWLSVAANVRMGADFPRYYWLMASGNTDRIDPCIEIGTPCHYLQGELCYLASIVTDDSPFIDPPSIPGAIREVVRTCLTDRRFDVLDRTDPWPFLTDFLTPCDTRLPASIPLVRLVNRIAGGTEPIHWRNVTPTVPTGWDTAAGSASPRPERAAPPSSE